MIEGRKLFQMNSHRSLNEWWWWGECTAHFTRIVAEEWTKKKVSYLVLWQQGEEFGIAVWLWHNQTAAYLLNVFEIFSNIFEIVKAGIFFHFVCRAFQNLPRIRYDSAAYTEVDFAILHSYRITLFTGIFTNVGDVVSQRSARAQVIRVSIEDSKKSTRKKKKGQRVRRLPRRPKRRLY